jgi:peptide/nickel transport system ATP-binding protein
MSGAPAPLLAVNGLTTSFRTGGAWRAAVNDLSFHLDATETLAIVGESGSGKSVTALSLMGLVPSVNGRVEGEALLSRRDLLALPEAEMRRVRGNDIAMIFQEPMTSLNPVMTVGSQIAEVLRYHLSSTGAVPVSRHCACLIWCAYPMRGAGSTITPISSRAACVSAS